ncbi:MAG: asparagine synthase-related protein [Haloferacaceae archaeon]
MPGAGEGFPAALSGFAGRLDGAFIRDVLGREPLFLERAVVEDGGEVGGGVEDGEKVGGGVEDGGGSTDLDEDECPTHARGWAFAPDTLQNPVPFPAGVAWSPHADGAWDRRRKVWTLPTPPVADDDAFERVLTALAPALGIDVGATEELSRPTEDGDVAVAFSGGIDSALLAAGRPGVPLYVVGFEGSHDLAAAREAAEAMGRLDDLREIRLTHDELRRWVPRVANATRRTNAMDVSIALPLAIVAERAAADGCEALAVGQGADELFGGYAKVVDPADDARVDATTVRGAVRESIATLPDQLGRDVPAIRAAGVDVVAPYLQDRVVDAALRLPGSLLVEEGTRKVALRRFAARTGALPRSVWTAEKKALQYGTYVSRELDRLARRNGFKRRMNRHVDRYVESLVAETE